MTLPYFVVPAVKIPRFIAMSQVKTEQKATPKYLVKGERLRARKEELIKSGRLQNDLAEIAKGAGVSVSGFQQWERGETWPRADKRAKLAAMLEWTEQELEFGPQASAEGGSTEMSSHPVSPDELEILALYRGLEDQKTEVRQLLIAKLHARHMLKQNVRGQLKTLSDEGVERRMPVTRAGKMPARKKGSAEES
jgi:transcriptional regulator with XRE-family HTH domain